MPECKAIKSFNSAKYGFIRHGSRFSSEKGYANELRMLGLIEILPDTLQPARVQAHAAAPMGKEPPASPPPSLDPPLAGPPAAGAARPSALSRAGQALRRRTATTSKDDAKP
jgi:hypothetical protein